MILRFGTRGMVDLDESFDEMGKTTLIEYYRSIKREKERDPSAFPATVR